MDLLWELVLNDGHSYSLRQRAAINRLNAAAGGYMEKALRAQARDNWGNWTGYAGNPPDFPRPEKFEDFAREYEADFCKDWGSF